MKKSLVLVLAIALLVGSAVPVFAANPFADVPADHWAYDAVVQLAAVGLVEGYPDGTYGGTRMMTRYEAALVFARTLARLEALVEDEVYSTNAGLRDAVTADVLADIEAAKAELVALIKEELANIEVPVVESTVERVVVEQPIEKVVEVQPIERPFVMTPEAEEVIAQLVAKLAKEEIAAAQLNAADAVKETTIIERIVEAENAVTEEDVVRIAEELLADALAGTEEYSDAQIAAVLRRIRGVEERQAERNEEVLGMIDEVREETLAQVDGLREETLAQVDGLREETLGLIAGVRNDVAGLQAGMDAEVAALTDTIYAMNEEFENELGLLGVRIGSLERLFIALEDRVTAVEARVAQVESGQADLQKQIDKVQLSGKLAFEGKTGNESVTDYFGKSVMTEQTLGLKQVTDLTLTVQASDSVTVKAFLNGEITDFDTPEFQKYGVEVTSDTPVTRLVAGTLNGDDIGARFSSYVLDTKPATGALADFTLFDGFEGNLVLGGITLGGADDIVGGLGLSYSFIPELGLKASVTGTRNGSEVKAASAGVFGEVLGFNYEGTFAMDLTDTNAEDAMLFGASVKGEVGPANLSAAFVMAGEDFGVEDTSLSTASFVKDGSSKLDLGAGVEFLGINLKGDYYREMDDEFAALVDAFNFSASSEFDVVVPLSVSGKFAYNTTDGVEDPKSSSELKVAVNDLAVFDTGLTVGASAAMVNNFLDDNWKDIEDYTNINAFVLTGNLGYATDFSGADLNLGYNAKLVVPREDVENADDKSANELTHTITAGYGFTDNLKLDMTAKLFHYLEEGAELGQEYKAGLTFTF